MTLKKTNNGKKENNTILFLITIVAIIAIFAVQITALPVGPQITKVKNETSNSAGQGTASSADRGGYITTLRLNASQQNYAWKAYVGNITGNLVLENANNYSIYEWPISSGNQEVYISRNQTINWANINCSNRTIIETEDTYLNLTSSATNSINKTFNQTIHKTFIIAGQTIQNSTCPAIATYINDTPQTINETAKFQEVLLTDRTNLIYATLTNPATTGYDTATYDFQTIVAEDETKQTPTTYYFYIELS